MFPTDAADTIPGNLTKCFKRFIPKIIFTDGKRDLKTQVISVSA